MCGVCDCMHVLCVCMFVCVCVCVGVGVCESLFRDPGSH